MNLREQIEKTLDFSDDVGLTEDQLRNLLNLILASSYYAKNPVNLSGGGQIVVTSPHTGTLQIVPPKDTYIMNTNKIP